MNFTRYIQSAPIASIDLTPFINMVLIITMSFILLLSVAAVPSLNIKLPKAVTSEMINDRDAVIIVTSENIIYADSRVVTLAELKDYLSRTSTQTRSIMIKADRRASVGRLVDIWDLSRNLGFERINVASDQGD